ncbi:hypothetical protein AAHA92_32929 [Salvia divinorum]|uniref:Uncharacterized protein n=1 Tax=Salvia divinorum TaxID=28513 RepID=A0ABD1FMA9_SALDI
MSILVAEISGGYIPPSRRSSSVDADAAPARPAAPPLQLRQGRLVRKQLGYLLTGGILYIYYYLTSSQELQQ